jgi:hypothetical protein
MSVNVGRCHWLAYRSLRGAEVTTEQDRVSAPRAISAPCSKDCWRQRFVGNAVSYCN